MQISPWSLEFQIMQFDFRSGITALQTLHCSSRCSEQCVCIQYCFSLLSAFLHPPYITNEYVHRGKNLKKKSLYDFISGCINILHVWGGMCGAVYRMHMYGHMFVFLNVHKHTGIMLRKNYIKYAAHCTFSNSGQRETMEQETLFLL